VADERGGSYRAGMLCWAPVLDHATSSQQGLRILSVFMLQPVCTREEACSKEPACLAAGHFCMFAELICGRAEHSHMSMPTTLFCLHALQHQWAVDVHTVCCVVCMCSVCAAASAKPCPTWCGALCCQKPGRALPLLPAGAPDVQPAVLQCTVHCSRHALRNREEQNPGRGEAAD
jgi:hypothetical protein